jgi:CheY-like chemotaxis protein
MNGMNTATEIRARERSGKYDGRVPIIVVSGNTRPEHKEKALAVGADGYMIKPYSRKDLETQIASIMGHIKRR